MNAVRWIRVFESCQRQGTALAVPYALGYQPASAAEGRYSFEFLESGKGESSWDFWNV